MHCSTNMFYSPTQSNVEEKSPITDNQQSMFHCSQQCTKDTLKADEPKKGSRGDEVEDGANENKMVPESNPDCEMHLDKDDSNHGRLQKKACLAVIGVDIDDFYD